MISLKENTRNWHQKCNAGSPSAIIALGMFFYLPKPQLFSFMAWDVNLDYT